MLGMILFTKSPQTFCPQIFLCFHLYQNDRSGCLQREINFACRICRCVIIWFHTQFRYHLLQHILLRQRPFKLCKNPVSINDNACIQICHGKQKPDIKHINFERIQIHEINFPYRKRSSLIKRFIVRPPCQWNLYVAFLITLYHISLWQSRQHF